MRTLKAFQILESLEADFEKMTWTFGIGPSDEVYAGQVAVLPSDGLLKMSTRLAHAEGLLKEVMADNNFSGLNGSLAERMQKHFDPEPL